MWILCVLVALAAKTVWALGTAQPTMFIPKGTTTQIRITGIDGPTDPGSVDGNEGIFAVGVWWDGSKAGILLLKYSGTGWNKEHALMSTKHATLTSDVEPKVFARERRILIVYTLPGTNEMFFLDWDNSAGQSCNKWFMIRLILPASPADYRNSYDVSYVREYMTIAGIAANRFWFMTIKTKDGNQDCIAIQENSVAQTTCASCAVNGNNNDHILIGGKYKNKLQILLVKRD